MYDIIYVLSVMCFVSMLLIINDDNSCLGYFWYYIDYLAHSGSMNLLVWRLVDMVVYLYGSASQFASMYY